MTEHDLQGEETPQQSETGAEQELRRHRLAKLERIRQRGDEPYKYIFDRSHAIAEARTELESLEKEAGEDVPPAFEARLAGRIVASRIQGKSPFIEIRDEKARQADPSRRDHSLL